MAILTEFLVSIADVVKPEVKKAQRRSVRMITFSVIGLGFLLGGASLLLWGLFIMLQSLVEPQGAALIAGGVGVIAGLITILLIHRETA